MFINFRCNIESKIIKRQRRRLNLNKKILNIDNFDATDLNRNVDENLISKSKTKKIELILKKIDRADVYEII